MEVKGDFFNFGNYVDVHDNEKVELSVGEDVEINKTDKGLYPYISLLKTLIEPLRESGNWKAILCPYKAAVVEGVLPKWPHIAFCSLTKLNVPASTFSEWMRDDSYTLEELDPYSDRFCELKRQIDNSK